MPTSVFSDDFSNASYPQLLRLRPGWTASRTNFEGNGFGAQVTAGGVLSMTYPGDGNFYAYTGNMGKSDMYLTFRMLQSSFTNIIALRFVDENNFIGITHAAGSWYIRKRIAGAAVSGGVIITQALDTAADYTISVVGNNYDLRKNGVSIGTFTDADFNTAKAAGVIMNGGQAGWLESMDRGYEGAAPSGTIDLFEPKVFNCVDIDDVLDMTFSGAYTGNPASIRAQLEYLDGTIIRPWATVIAAPAGGVFNFSLLNIPPNPATGTPGNYTLDAQKRYVCRVDFSNDATVADFTATSFWIGYVAHIYGQSNAAGLNLGVSALALLGSSFFDGSGYSVPTGIGQVELCNNFIKLRGAPILISNKSVGGMTIDNLIFGGNWTAFMAMVAAQGTGFVFVLWDQYEGNLVANIAAGFYKGKIEQLDTQLAALSPKYRRLLLNLGGRFEGDSGTNDPWFNILLADMEAAAAVNARIEISHTRRDLPQIDNVHLTATRSGYGEHGSRFGRTCARWAGAGVNDARGPVIVSGIIIDNDWVEFTCDLNGSATLELSSTTIASIKVEAVGGGALALQAGTFVLTAANKFKVRLAAAPGGDVRVFNMIGADPDTVSIIRGDLVA
jgi:hypothetical protein